MIVYHLVPDLPLDSSGTNLVLCLTLMVGEGIYVDIHVNYATEGYIEIFSFHL